MSKISELEPRDFFGYFEELSKIPRPSGHEEAVGQWLMDLAEEHGLEHHMDSLGNVVIIREADPGKEDREPVILQGHMDMVCEKDPGVEKDMEKEGLDLLLEGDMLRAKGTTLGGDDGVAVCYALSFLFMKESSFPRIEFVCTVSEETGLEGANGIDLSMLKGRRLINIDSEDEGIVITGCAGGALMDIALPVSRTEVTEGAVVDITLSGLLSGHSGNDIDKGRANAVISLGTLLAKVSKEVDIRFISIVGGNKDNVIPGSCRASVWASGESRDELMERLGVLSEEIKKEYRDTEKDMCFSFAYRAADKDRPLDRGSSDRTLDILSSIPNGVLKMGADMPETSLNLGICSLKASDDTLSLKSFARSQKDSELKALVDRVREMSGKVGAEFNLSGYYSPWEKKESSPLQDLILDTYTELTGKEPLFTEVHAGLECGILMEKLPDLDAVSVGPDLYDIHTPKERMSVSSVKRVYEFFVKLLHNL
ncbi:MAG: beta-Ala-His dipeptidase [Lachnospiraceae bacterium]|nr:beta-Ala-His dipeptidase [Lachnospiraceae bacterium]